MEDETHGASSAHHGENAAVDDAIPASKGEASSSSGWTTTKQAAKALGVSRRSVQEYVRQGLLEARVEGEGVSKTFYISIDSLNALRNRRAGEGGSPNNFADTSPDSDEAASPSPSPNAALRHAIDRLEARTVEATELRIRLELTEQAQSTLEEQLAKERLRREEAERRAEELARRLAETRDASEMPSQTTEGVKSSDQGEDPQAKIERRSWWRRWFGLE